MVSLDDELRPTVRIESPWGAGTITLSVRGEHQAVNAAAAVATAVCAGVGFEAALAGVATARGQPAAGPNCGAPRRACGCSTIRTTPTPRRCEAALRSLARVDADRRVAVLGEMAELGETGPPAHRAIGDLAESLGIEIVAVAGAPYGGTAVATQDEALAFVESLPSDSVVLVKASRSVGLDRLVSRLRDGVGVR